MTSTGELVPESVVRTYLPSDIALYSMWMPGDETTAAIQSTTTDPICTYDEVIEIDTIHQACALYLIRAGAPVFRNAAVHHRYTKALEAELRRGLAPIDARDMAMRAVASGVDAAAPR